MALTGQAKKDYMKRYNAEYDHTAWADQNRDKTRANSAKHQAAHSEEITETRRLRRNSNVVHMAKANEHAGRRRARLREQLCDCCTRADLFEFYVIANMKTEETGIPHEVDHVQSIASGGAHCAKNLRVITMAANRKKGSR